VLQLQLDSGTRTVFELAVAGTPIHMHASRVSDSTLSLAVTCWWAVAAVVLIASPVGQLTEVCSHLSCGIANLAMLPSMTMVCATLAVDI
jgi:hypothetical protein